LSAGQIDLRANRWMRQYQANGARFSQAYEPGKEPGKAKLAVLNGVK